MFNISLDDNEKDLLKDSSKIYEARLHVMYKITEIISALNKSNELYIRTLKLLFDTFPRAETGVLFLTDKNENVDIDNPVAYLDRNVTLSYKVPLSRNVIKMCINKKVCILIKDAKTHPKLGSASIYENNMSSVLASPLYHSEKLKGVIILASSTSSVFNTEDQQLLKAISSQLALSLNAHDAMIEKLREIELRNQLERYTTPELAKSIQEGTHNIELGGTKHDGVILFSDIVGFTTISESLTVEKLILRLNTILKDMIPVIFETNGSIDKFWGDSIMAYWNILSKIENAEIEATRTALKMHNEIFKFNIIEISRDELCVKIGVGLHCGDVIAGNIGSHNRMDFTLLGRNVNVAKRVESETSGNCVFMTEDMFKRIGTKYIAIKLKPSIFKNVSAPMILYSIKGIKTGTGYVTSIPVIARSNMEVREAKIIYIGEGAAILMSDFKLTIGKKINLEIWLPELDDEKHLNAFEVVNVETVDKGVRTLYKIELKIGTGFLTTWFKERILESKYSSNELQRNPKLI
jgi:class 3 adenylate cyclase